ncbi:unnamed protein product [Bursaphelenchus xylophilus]|uniref:(pine wood nematode) hypothetical protein n=1 Tax=Bursaphelenchus xylophilus TaxID=6326 RepID=A0A7I8X1C9_BURXY|nr:unnamed protein product [Bursaphelenchus xylophilus]CAG9130492.1 unnamed protein product [Bursaphelenchus xylophilus]
MLAETPLYMDNLAMSMDSKTNNSFSNSPVSEESNSQSRPNISPELEHPAADEKSVTSPRPAPCDSLEVVQVQPTRKKSQKRSIVCEFEEEGKPQCKQRAILSYRFCIRHILNDLDAPYKRCEFMIRNKIQCTNAIKKDLNSIYCSTHLIKRGEKEAKRRKKPEAAVTNDSQNSMGSDVTSPSLHEDGLNSSFDSVDQIKSSEPVHFVPQSRPIIRRVDNGFHSDQYPQTSRAFVTETRVVEAEPHAGPYLGNDLRRPYEPGFVVHKYIPENGSNLPRVRNLQSRKCPVKLMNCKVAPVCYDSSILNVGENMDEVEKLKRDYLNENGNQKTKRQKKEIQLAHKCRNIRIKGPFRSIGLIDTMCNQVEGMDFDNSDLFPLGFEPSDSESSSDESSVDNCSAVNLNPRDFRQCRLELYLLKKRLKRESEKLQWNARLSVNVIAAARSYPDQVGSAFKTREVTRKRYNNINSLRHRCFYFYQNTQTKCDNIAVPRSSLCMEHIGYSVDQKAFVFCSTPCCGKPVLKMNAMMFGGKCEEHHFLGLQSQEVSVHNGIRKFHNNGHDIPKTNGHHTATLHVQNNNCNESGRLTDEHDTSADNQLINSITMDDFNVTDVVDGDVSLSSVANDLFDNHELNDMLSQFPSVDDPPSENGGDLDGNDELLNVFTNPVDDSEEGMAHSWADIHEFLRSEGYQAGSPSHPAGN